MTTLTLNQALQRHQAGDLAQAEAAYLALLKSEPNNPELLHLLAILYSHQKRYHDALPFMTQALELAPDRATFHNSMGNIQKKQQQLDLAKQHYQQALRLDPNSQGALNNLGALCLQQGDTEQAIGYYQKACALEPTIADTHYHLALCHLQENQSDQARNELQQCLSLDPDHFFALAALGKLDLTDEHYASAVDRLQKSVQLYDQNVDTLVNLGAALVKTGDLQQAIEWFTRAHKQEPDHFEAQYNLGCTHLSLQQPKKALEYFLRLLKDTPNPDVYYNIGVIYLYQDHHSEAISYLQQATRLNPSYLDAFINLGVTYLKMNNRSKAIDYFSQALEIQPNNAEVTYILAALKGDQSPVRAPAEYVQNLFDQYAPHYDTHLNEYLSYETPQHLLAVTQAALADQLDQLNILDLGCGTGMTGAVFKPYAKRLVGVDLSAKMIEAAEQRDLYDQLYRADITDDLSEENAADLIIAGDVLSYLGDLEPIFLHVRSSLAPGGHFAFSVERYQDPLLDYQLQPTARFAHARQYIERLAETHGFTIVQCAQATLRRQNNQPVTGLFFVLQKPQAQPKKENEC